MNPLSSISPIPPGADSSSPIKETDFSSQDPAEEASAPNPPMDVVSLSAPTQEASHYLEQMSQIPDVRQARITHIQKAIDSNSYVISPENLADTLIQELHTRPQETRPPTAS